MNRASPFICLTSAEITITNKAVGYTKIKNKKIYICETMEDLTSKVRRNAILLRNSDIFPTTSYANNNLTHQ